MKTILSLLGMSMLLIVTALAVSSPTSVATSIEGQHRTLTCCYMLVSLPGGKLIPGRELAHPTGKCPLLEQDARNLRSMQTGLCSSDA
jgi:hypothetical protein